MYKAGTKCLDKLKRWDTEDLYKDTNGFYWQKNNIRIRNLEDLKFIESRIKKYGVSLLSRIEPEDLSPDRNDNGITFKHLYHFMAKVVLRSGSSYNDIPDSWKDSKYADLMYCAIKKNSYASRIIDPNLYLDQYPDLLKYAIIDNINNLQYLPKQFQTDEFYETFIDDIQYDYYNFKNFKYMSSDFMIKYFDKFFHPSSRPIFQFHSNIKDDEYVKEANDQIIKDIFDNTKKGNLKNKSSKKPNSYYYSIFSSLGDESVRIFMRMSLNSEQVVFLIKNNINLPVGLMDDCCITDAVELAMKLSNLYSPLEHKYFRIRKEMLSE